MHYWLFTTTTCPKCPPFKTFMQTQTYLKGEILDETSSTFSTSIARFGLTKAPTLLVLSADEKTVLLHTSELAEGQAFIEKQTRV